MDAGARIRAHPVLDRAFDVAAPNHVWAADITYVRTWEGWPEYERLYKDQDQVAA